MCGLRILVTILAIPILVRVTIAKVMVGHYCTSIPCTGCILIITIYRVHKDAGMKLFLLAKIDKMNTSS